MQWADVVLISTPIRWGQASALYYRMAERLNCIQNQLTLHNRCLIGRKVAAFVITGGQDNVQGVAGQMLTFWGELGFFFPAIPVHRPFPGMGCRGYGGECETGPGK